MRSLHLVSTNLRRGAEIFALQLVQELRILGLEAELAALTPSTGAEALQIGTLGRSRRSVQVLWNLRRAARCSDVVVAHGSSTLEASAVALVGTGTPFVYRSIGDPSYWATGWKRRWMKTLHFRPERHVALWRAAAGDLAARYGLETNRIDVIPNAVPAARWLMAADDERRRARLQLGLKAGRPTLAFVGALSAEKNVDAAMAAAELTACALLVVGEGPLRASLEHVAPSSTTFLGSLEDPRPVYAAADLLILPSDTEGMPGVVIEAGMVGTAALTTAVGALPEMIEHESTGFLAASTEPSILAGAIEDALPLAKRVGRAAEVAFRERYSMERVVPMWIRTLERAAEGRR